MEWSELLPEDRRQLRSLLNLDENGLPNQPSTTSSSSSDTTKAAAASSPLPPIVVTYSQIRSKIEVEILKSLPYWKAVSAMERESAPLGCGAPVIASSSFSILEVIPCTCFTEFLVVMARAKFTLECEPLKKRGKKRGRDSSEAVVKDFVFETMHFAHKSDLEKGYEVQSVHLPGKPLALQCVAGDLLSVGLLALQLARPAAGTVQLPTSVAVYGMGGNVIPMALAKLLPEGSMTHVVEIEPAVVAMCTTQGLMPPSSRVVCHVCGMEEAMERQVVGSDGVELAIVDCFDPNACTMLHQETVLQMVKDKVLRPGCGVAIINAHIPCTPESLEVLCRVFGEAYVLVLSLFDGEQSLLVGANFRLDARADMRQWNKLVASRMPQLTSLLSVDTLRASRSRTVKTAAGSVVTFSMCTE